MMELSVLNNPAEKTIKDLEGKTYMTCSACMSVWADGLSWANAHPERVTKKVEEADNIAVLSCQVTDLAILSDLRTAERYHARFPGKQVFISGCLAKRRDIGLPEFVKRLETPRENYQFLWDRSLVHFERPFWVRDFKEEDKEHSEGHLFRSRYPLRIGKGCPNHCTYCTIRVTRGDFEQYATSRLESEFLTFDNVLLVADSPTEQQVKEWCAVAQKHRKGFSIRNVEPSVVVRCKSELVSLAEQGLLQEFHSPIQSSSSDVLRDMHRNVQSTLQTMELARGLKERGVYIATNIIIDYKNFKQDFSEVYKLYDYVSWNPLWDGVWNRTRAEERFEKYIVRGETPEVPK
jgi:tRNA A37 methylthiotransferase MiaB